MCPPEISITLHACRDCTSQNRKRIILRFRNLSRMALDSDSLGSLRIDRSAAPTGGGTAKRLVYIGVSAVLLAAIAVGLWFWLGAKTIEVSTVTAEADSAGPSLGNSVLNASGYVV